MDRDALLGTAFKARHAHAREHLANEMTRLGLLASEGWRIHEFTRHVDGKIELVMRPIHSRLASPEGLECVICIDEPAMKVEASCHDAERPSWHSLWSLQQT